jgi:hypothetical protein
MVSQSNGLLNVFSLVGLYFRGHSYHTMITLLTLSSTDSSRMYKTQGGVAFLSNLRMFPTLEPLIALAILHSFCFNSVFVTVDVWEMGVILVFHVAIELDHWWRYIFHAGFRLLWELRLRHFSNDNIIPRFRDHFSLFGWWVTTWGQIILNILPLSGRLHPKTAR